MNNPIFFGVALLLLVCCLQTGTGQNAESGEDPSFEAKRWILRVGHDEFIRCGLGTLSEDNLRALDQTFTDLIRINTPSSNLWRAAQRKMRLLGWEAVDIEWRTKNGEEWLVVPRLLTKRATKDLPLLINPIVLPSGCYWGKRRVFGGLSDIIDSSGSEHSFLLSEWTNL